MLNSGSPQIIAADPNSNIGPYLNGTAKLLARTRQLVPAKKSIDFTVADYYNIKKITGQLPVGRLSAITGFSGAGKTSLILDSLVPAITDQANGRPLPKQVKSLTTPLKNVVSVDAAPIGKTTRSTVATYTSIMDNLRKLFAAQPLAKERHYTASYFSYNNKHGGLPNLRRDRRGNPRHPIFAGHAANLPKL